MTVGLNYIPRCILIIAYFGDGVKAESSGKNSGEWRVGRMGLDSRGLMDFLIRDVGVDFLGEVVVFSVHL